MLGRLGIWRHVVVAISIAVCVVLALLGVIGGRGESFDSKQITVWPEGTGVRIQEVVDQDFGTSSHHGYERLLPNDFGAPVDVEAESPDANDDVSVTAEGADTRIRVGSPDEEFTGQHRYVLSYTLPVALSSTPGRLDLDIVDATTDQETKRFELILTGFVLDNPICSVGSVGDEGNCTVERVGSDYRVVFTPLAAGDGLNVEAEIVSVTTPVVPPLPDLPDRATDRRLLIALLMIPIGLIGATGVFVWARRRGRNEVFSGGAVEAAYGKLPAPGAVGTDAAVSTMLVPDSKMDELATIEFVPPRGLQPWQGAVLLNERIGNDTVAAWFSGLAAHDVITLRQENGDLVLGAGERRDRVPQSDVAIVDELFNGRSELQLGSYDKQFATAWRSIQQQQVSMIRSSGWWKRGTPGGASAGSNLIGIFIAALILVFFVGGSVAAAALGAVRWWPLALVFGLVVPSVTALVVYATMLPARSATGSALTLLTESFRRFLHASEGRHVEWAWKQGLLREYSAWAVALGAADAWGRALANSNVPEPEYTHSNPLLVYSMGSAFAHSHTAPSSSGSSGGGGGFSSGGGVGGGGGGGSSGSW